LCITKIFVGVSACVIAAKGEEDKDAHHVELMNAVV